ncbi:MAG: lysophospholipid acyltransferase family protein [Treponemataceae bacterium]
MIVITLIVVLSGLIFWGFVNIFAYAISKKLSLRISNAMMIYCPKIIFGSFNLLMKFKTVFSHSHKNELPEQYLILSNHQSVLDIPLFMKFLPKKKLRFVAKSDLARVIVSSEMLRVQQHALIHRTGGASSTMKVLDTFAENIKKNNYCPVLFPEGSRSRNGQLISFKSAGFRRLMEKVPLPVAVCALDGGYKISSIVGIINNMRGGSYRLKILKIFPTPHTKTEQLAVLEESKNLIQNQLDEWRK